MLNLINNQGIQIETVMRYCNRMLPGGRPQIGICNGVQKSLEIIGSTPESHTCPECWQLWPIVGGARNGPAEEDWCWDLNPGMAAIPRERTLRFWGRRERGPCGFGGGGREARRFWGRRWGEPRCFGRVGTPWQQHS